MDLGKRAKSEEGEITDLTASADGPEPDIPQLGPEDGKKKERKGAGFAVGGGGGGQGGGLMYRWFGVGAKPAGSMAGRAAIGLGKAGGAAKLGLLPTAINFLSSNGGLVLLTAAITGTAVYTLYTLGMASVKDGGAPSAGVFSTPPRASSSAQGPVEGQGGDPSSLSFFTSVNAGAAFNDAAGPAKTEETLPKAEEAKPPAEEPKDGPVEPTGPKLAEELAAALPKPKMLANKGFTEGRGVGLGSGVGLAGGPGMAGGMMRKFEKQPTQDLKAFQKDSRAKVARGASPVSRIKGGKGAMGQLQFANKKSRGSLGQTTSEGKSFEAAQAFETAPPKAGAGLASGGGLGQGGAGLDPSLSTSDGGPITTPYTGEQPAPGSGKTGDKSPWTADVMLAASLLMTASTIIMIIGILALFKGMPIIGPILAGIQLMLYVAATGMAATATGLGAYIMSKHGQMAQGAILTTGGAITTACAVASLAAPQAVSSWVSVLGGIAGIAASVGTLLSGMMGGSKK